jgi:hypothetical protein
MKEKSFYQVTSTIYVKEMESNNNSLKQPLHKWHGKKEKLDNHWKNKKTWLSKARFQTTYVHKLSKTRFQTTCAQKLSTLPIIWLIENQHRQIKGSL